MMKMKLKAIHLFIILLGSLVLCGILGGVCSNVEGMSNGSYTGPAGDTVEVDAPNGSNAPDVSNAPNGSNAPNVSNSNFNSIESTANSMVNDGETAFGSLLSGISSDFNRVKKGVKSLGSDVVGEYDSLRDNVESRISDPVQSKPMNRSTQYPNVVRGPTQEIPRSQIPAGDEHLYILKSQIVPPVCPACPSSSMCPRQEPPPPCPPCARCPEPSFECKKVPNYSSNNSQYLPRPVLADFSQFGM